MRGLGYPLAFASVDRKSLADNGFGLRLHRVYIHVAVWAASVAKQCPLCVTYAYVGLRGPQLVLRVMCRTWCMQCCRVLGEGVLQPAMPRGLCAVAFVLRAWRRGSADCDALSAIATKRVTKRA